MRCLIRRGVRLVVSVITGIAVVLGLVAVALACLIRVAVVALEDV